MRRLRLEYSNEVSNFNIRAVDSNMAAGGDDVTGSCRASNSADEPDRNWPTAGFVNFVRQIFIILGLGLVLASSVTSSVLNTTADVVRCASYLRSDAPVHCFSDIYIHAYIKALLK